MHMASTRQRSASGEYGRVKNSSRAPGRAQRHRGERPRREDHERGDPLAALVKKRVVLERRVEVALAVEDRDRDVATGGEEVFELGRPADRDGVEACLPQLSEDGTLL